MLNFIFICIASVIFLAGVFVGMILMSAYNIYKSYWILQKSKKQIDAAVVDYIKMRKETYQRIGMN